MINCLTEGMKKLTINYEKVKEVQQEQDEIPAFFQRRLEEVFRKYTNVDLSSSERWVLLAMHLIAQSAPDIRQTGLNLESNCWSSDFNE